MKRGRKPTPELSPEMAALSRLDKDGASSNAAVRRRIALIAAERRLPVLETAPFMKGRYIPLMPLGRFAKKHSLSVDWLISRNLKGLQRMQRTWEVSEIARAEQQVEELKAAIAKIPAHLLFHAIEVVRSMSVKPGEAS